jgi:hypothetical protein
LQPGELEGVRNEAEDKAVALLCSLVIGTDQTSGGESPNWLVSGSGTDCGDTPGAETNIRTSRSAAAPSPLP